VPDLKPVYLLTGTDRPKIDTALARLRRHFAAEAIEVGSAHTLSGDEAASLCNTASLFGDARLVVVTDVERWKAADVKALEGYLAAPAPATTLALVAGELRKDAALAKVCARSGEVLAYDVPKRNLGEWVADQFRQRGARAEPGASAALVALAGDDPQALATEVDKLATWAAGEPIGEREVEALAAAVAETPTFTLTDAWGRRDVAAVLEASETILEREGRPRRDTAPRLAAALGSHVTRVRSCQRLAAEGVRPRDAAQRLKLHPFYAEKLFSQAERFSATELGDALVRLAALDLALKGGSRLSPDLELQRALVDATVGMPGRAPAAVGVALRTRIGMKGPVP
jgi:DNA polymerase-3 subunit delta